MAHGHQDQSQVPLVEEACLNAFRTESGDAAGAATSPLIRAAGAHLWCSYLIRAAGGEATAPLI